MSKRAKSEGAKEQKSEFPSLPEGELPQGQAHHHQQGQGGAQGGAGGLEPEGAEADGQPHQGQQVQAQEQAVPEYPAV